MENRIINLMYSLYGTPLKGSRIRPELFIPKEVIKKNGIKKWDVVEITSDSNKKRNLYYVVGFSNNEYIVIRIDYHHHEIVVSKDVIKETGLTLKDVLVSGIATI